MPLANLNWLAIVSRCVVDVRSRRIVVFERPLWKGVDDCLRPN